MKTKDFIKMLQEADPSGEAYIRLPDSGAPYYAELKEGYWDGAYQYMENPKDWNSKLITSTKGMKVDIYTKDIYDIVWDEDGDINRIKDKVVFDYTYAGSINDEKVNGYHKIIEREAEMVRKYHEKSVKEWTKRVLEQWFTESGLFKTEIRQPLDKPIGYYNYMKAHTLFKIPEQLCQGECMAIIESGEFYPEKKKNHYVWKHDPDKGKNWSMKNGEN